MADPTRWRQTLLQTKEKKEMSHLKTLKHKRNKDRTIGLSSAQLIRLSNSPHRRKIWSEERKSSAKESKILVEQSKYPKSSIDGKNKIQQFVPAKVDFPSIDIQHENIKIESKTAAESEMKEEVLMF